MSMSDLRSLEMVVRRNLNDSKTVIVELLMMMVNGGRDGRTQVSTLNST